MKTDSGKGSRVDWELATVQDQSCLLMMKTVPGKAKRPISVTLITLTDSDRVYKSS